MKKNDPQAGLVKLIILIIIAVLVLSYLGVNIQKITESETGQANFTYLWQICLKIGDWFVDIYNQYLAVYFDKIWGYLPKSLVK